jgi:hypothetical protein
VLAGCGGATTETALGETRGGELSALDDRDDGERAAARSA